jgi:hypothetical protein
MRNKIVKTLCVAFFAFVVMQNAFAQTAKTWSFGPEIGLNFSKFGKDADQTSYKTGLLAGGFLTYSIVNTFGVTGKVLYTQMGAKDDDSNIESRLNYIEVPILARFFLNKEGDIRPNIFLGPSFGFLTGVQAKLNNGDYESVKNYEDVYNTFDLGIGAGAGVNIRIGEEKYFIIDARYTHGLSDISKTGSDVNNQAFAISAGLSFGLNH